MSTQLSRRTVARGAAWAVPAVTVVASAPAMAVSAKPVLNANNTVTWDTAPNGSDTGDYQFRVYSAPDSNVNPPNSVSSCGPEVTGANASTTVTNVTMTFWLPASNLKFVNNSSGTKTSGWTVLARDTSADDGSQDTDGSDLYAYSTSYSGPVTAVGGKICLGVQNFVTTNADDNLQPASYNAILRATVNGAIQTDPGTDVPIPQD